MRASSAALIPVAVASLAVLLAAALGVTERSAIGTPVEDFFYGFFLRSYPLFLFCMIYGTARLLAAAVARPGRHRVLRLATAPLALAAFLAAGFYPTFGGLVLRAGYAAGGLAFLQSMPGTLAAALGAGVAAAAFAACLGLATILATLRVTAGRRSALAALLRLAALVAGAILLVLASPLALGAVGAFPVRPMTLGQGIAAALLVAAAVLPHALLSARGETADDM